MEERLHGRWGQRTYEIDSRNRIVRTISYTPPVSGEDVQLSIDLDLQYYAERLLITQLQSRRQQYTTNPEVTKPNGQQGPMDPDLAVGTPVHYKAPAGSVTVMDQNTGQIVAMASYPTFDNRWFSAGIDGAKFNELFPPGHLAATTPASPTGRSRASTTWVRRSRSFTAYSALASGKLSAESTFYDDGVYKMTSIDPERCAEGVRCEFRNATCANGLPCRYGSVNVQASLAVSSDAFYYKLGEDFYLTPGTPFQDLVRTIGLGADTGIDLPGEFAGRVPTNELKAELLEDGVLAEGETPNLQPGDLLQMAIGQGLMAATPLQLGVGYAAIGNGGHVVTPRVVKAIYAPETPGLATSPASPT